MRENDLPMGPDSFRVDAWRDEAACRGASVEASWWFPEGYGAQQRSPARALAVCATCPVRRECLEYALSVPERHGVWGGMTESERRREQRRRDRIAAAARPIGVTA